MKVKTIGEYAIPTFTFLRVIDYDPGAATRNESYRKDRQSGKRKLMNAYLNTSTDINL